MAQVSGVSQTWNSPQYEGLLWTADQVPGRANNLPFMGILGGLTGADYRIVPDFDYAMTAVYDFADATQPDIDETDSLTAIAASSPVLSQVRNSCGIVQESVNISYKKLSTMSRIATDIVASSVGYWAKENTPIEDAIQSRKSYVLKKIARDLNYTFMNGVFQESTGVDVSGMTGGVVAATSTNATAAGSIELNESLLQAMFADCATNSGGQTFNSYPVMFVTAIQKYNISKIFGYQPTSWNMGGVAIDTILTDFGPVGVVFESMVPAGTVALVAMDAVRPVFNPVVTEDGSQGLMVYKDMAVLGGGYQGFFQAHIGIDYANELMHGKVTGIAQSRI